MDNKELIAFALSGKNEGGGTAIIPVSGATPSIAAEANSLYVCSAAVSALTVSSIPESGMFELVFRTGNELPTVSLPASVLLPDGFTFEADTIYDMSVLVCDVGGRRCGMAAVQSWPVPAAAE